MAKIRKPLEIEEGGCCCFCGCDDGTLVKHHIQVKGLSGMGMKPDDFFTIIVCHRHHMGCHEGLISQDMQMNKWIIYVKEKYIAEYGVVKGMKKLGKILWESLPGE